MPHTLTRAEREEVHAEKRAELLHSSVTTRKTSWIKRIRANDQRAISDLHNCVLERLTENACKSIFTKALDAPAAAGALFSELVADVLHQQCVADAERDVQWIERMRAGDAKAAILTAAGAANEQTRAAA